MPFPSPKDLLRSAFDWFVTPGTVAIFFSPSPPRCLAWSECRHILIVKLDEIGDFVLSTPFLRAMRRSAPHANLTLVVNPAVYNLAETCPYVDRVVVYDGNTRGLSAWQLRRHWRAWRLSREKLSRPRPDAAILPRWGEDAYHATILAAFCRPGALVAYSEQTTQAKRIMNRGVDRLLTHPVPPLSYGHEVEHNLALVEHFGGTVEHNNLELWPDESDRTFAVTCLPLGARYVALAPGAADPLRRWPAERFAALAIWLSTRHGLTPVVVGSATDPDIGGIIDLRGRTTLRQAVAVLVRCSFFVGNDSGLKHLAAAAGIPVVELSAFRRGGDPNHGNSPARFHAWGVPTRLLQPEPSLGDPLAIEDISLADTQSACDSLL